MDRRGAPRGAAVALVLLASFAVVGGILSFVISQFVEGAPQLVEQVTRSIDGLRNWLINGPLQLSKEQIDQAGNTAIEALQRNQEKLTTGALSTAGTLTELLTGALLVLFTLIFLLQGGRNIFAFVTKAFPTHVRDRVRDAGRAGFHSLGGYMRATFLVALVDAVGHRYRPGDHGYPVGAAAGLAGVPGRLHPAGRCGRRRIPGGRGGAAGQGVRLRPDHARADHRGAAARGSRAAAAGDGPRGVDSPAGGGAGHRGRRCPGRHRRRAARACPRWRSSTARPGFCWPRIPEAEEARQANRTTS